jgi:uncharacterized protein YkwD
MRRCDRLLCACLLALITIVPAGATARSAAKPVHCSVTAKGWKGHISGRKINATHPAVERRVILLVNRFRRRHGLHLLKLDPGLRYAARARGVIDKRLTARLALYSPSVCIAENVARRDGRSRAAGIVRSWREERGSRHALLLPWARHIGVGVRVATFNGERVTIATADFSAAHPQVEPRPAPVKPQPVLRPASPPSA